MTFALGVDGGNTKTVALVAAGSGRVLGTGRAGCADIYGASSAAAAIAEVERAVTAALGAAGITAAQIGTCVCSLAGADWPEDFELLRTRLRSDLGLDVEPVVVNDAVGAIRCGTPDGVGVAVVCGTYGVTGARGRDGGVFHVGFWPDSTGGDELAGRGLRAVWRADLELGAPTSLTARALALYGEPDAWALLHAFTRRAAPLKTQRARFGPVVLDEAAAGDPVARGIVEDRAALLAAEARTAARRVGLAGTPYPLVLAGGVFRHPSPLLAELIAAGVPDALPTSARYEPAVGALLLALDAVGAAVDESTLAASLPGPELYATVEH